MYLIYANILMEQVLLIPKIISRGSFNVIISANFCISCALQINVVLTWAILNLHLLGQNSWYKSFLELHQTILCGPYKKYCNMIDYATSRDGSLKQKFKNLWSITDDYDVISWSSKHESVTWIILCTVIVIKEFL